MAPIFLNNRQTIW